jgi:glyoxylase-like metal-dependent hydrolase (beta-lactamase superfamily II)
MDEVLDGVFHWKAVHPRIKIEVGCHFVAGSGTAIDPLLPAEGIEWFEGRGVQRVVLSNRHHLRHAPEIAERFGCPILCHEAGLHEFEGGPQVDGFAFGDRLAGDVVALEMDAICPEDTVLRIEGGGGALLFADSLINHGEVGFVPDNLIGEDPEAVKRRVRERAAALLDEEFEHLLFAHGDPLIGGGREALRAIADNR